MDRKLSPVLQLRESLTRESFMQVCDSLLLHSLSLGFMLTSAGPMVLEYNCRFGDPETQVLLPLLSSDLYPILLSCAEGNLLPSQVQWKQKLYASTVICASGGYPDSYQKGFQIEGLDKAKDPNVIVYHSGTTFETESNQLITNGGRVLAVTGLGETLRDAVAMSYGAINKISFTGMQYRRDIAHRYLLQTSFL
jgi:phosphoribosylamine---glycine ligase